MVSGLVCYETEAKPRTALPQPRSQQLLHPISGTRRGSALLLDAGAPRHEAGRGQIPGTAGAASPGPRPLTSFWRAASSSGR